MIEEVERILNEQVRPQLQQHYGNVQLLDVSDGIVRIKLIGQCGNCPSAKYTVEDIIAATLKKNIPEIKDVVLVNGVSEELLDAARKLLGRKDR